MFTGIIETLGKLISLEKEGTNVHFTFSSEISSELKIDQSLAHNGVCLTVIKVEGTNYTVTAIDETLKRTNLSLLHKGDFVNLERCMLSDGRFDGHVVQGHIDTTAQCISIENMNGSWVFEFKYESNPNYVTVEKGSITVNGVSLTVVESKSNSFTVHIIPYTYEHTNFKSLKIDSVVNLEFDIIGKYVAKLLNRE